MKSKAIPHDLKVTIAERISTLMARDNVTQYRLAQKLDLTESAISKMRNAITAPRIDRLIEIADYFKVSVDYLLGRTNEY